MSRHHYLIDTSVLTRQRNPSVAAATGPIVAAGLVAVCAPVMFEIGVTARNPVDHELLMVGLDAFGHVPVTDAIQRSALDVQSELITRGAHRSVSLVDTLVALTALANDLTVLHYDADFELLAEVVGCEQQWIVPRGSAEANG